MDKVQINAVEMSGQCLSLVAGSIVSDLAIQLAERVGEEVSRPLTRSQIERALSVLQEERAYMIQSLEAVGELQYQIPGADS